MIVAENRQLEAAMALLGGKKHRAQSLLQTLDSRPGETYRFIANQDDEIDAAVLVVINKGATATILATAPTTDSSAQDIGRLIKESVEGLRGTGCSIAQAVLPIHDDKLSCSYLDAGFAELACLKYMERSRSSKQPAPHTCDVRFIPMTKQTDTILGSILLETYEGSLDCPKIHGLRKVQDIIDGHRGLDHHDANLWSLAKLDGKLAGVLLLNAVPESKCMELAYLGVAPWARNQGLGNALVQRAVEQTDDIGFSKITLAVDAENHPAISLYSRWRFGETGQRMTMVCQLY